jgi:glycosyltransferase involved in cell wall biosynthesis
MSERMTEESRSTEVADLPLVLHVIPTPVARGAQREARALADHLDTPGRRHHRVLSLFVGQAEVAVDANLGLPGGDASSVGFDPRVVFRLRSALRRMDPDVVVAHGSEPLKYLVPAMLGRRRPLAYYAIGTYSGSRGALQVRLWRQLMGRADVVAAEGEDVRNECIQKLGVLDRRITVAPNGRDPDRFHPPPHHGPSPIPVVVFVGALTQGKGPDRFIQAIIGLRARGIRLEARLIGDGPMRQTLIGPAKAAGVEVLGSRPDVDEQLRAADVLVLPSRPAGEGMPGVLIEAALSGLPVVATAVPGVPSIVKDGETGFVVPVDDVPAMVHSTAKLLDDPGLRAWMGRAARQHGLDNFSLRAVGERWMTILQPLINSAVDKRSGR